MNECKIVQDILPLYAEDLIASETRAFVDSHCEGCEDCARQLHRCNIAIPTREKDPKAYKKALRKNQLNLICKLVVVLIAVIALLTYAAVKLEQYLVWKDGKSPVEQVIEAPTGYGKITLVDWEGSGRRIGNARNEGTLIWIEMAHFKEDETGQGWTGSKSESAEHWENVQAVWAPNGEEVFFSAELLDGGSGIFVHDYQFWEDEDGSHSVERMLPEGRTHGYLDILLEVCRDHPDFPDDWETVAFSFYQWQEDCETITFVYETDSGHRGLLDFHYPSETIVDID